MSSDAHYPIMFGEHKLYGDHILYYTYIYTHNIIPMIVLYVINMYIYMQNMRVVCHQYVYIYIHIYTEHAHIP